MSSDREDDGEYEEVRDVRLTTALRKAVHETFKKDPDNVTVRNIRTIVEEELGLGKEWFKKDSVWKQKSKEIIETEAEIENSRAEAEELEKERRALKEKTGTKKTVTKPPAKKVAPKKKATPEIVSDADEVDEVAEEDAPKQRKRARNTANTKASAKAKLGSESESEVDSILSDIDSDEFKDEPPPKKTKTSPKKSARGKSATKVKDDDDRSVSIDTTDGKGDNATPDVNAGGDSGDESEMSVLNDDPLPQRKRGKSAAGTAKKEKATPKPKAKKPKASAKELSPDEEKIKSLQSWLLKCGVRKVWGRELAKFETAKEKIAHLKKMLEDIGMTGQYSLAKAKKIKEERELQAELDSIRPAADENSEGSGDEVKARSGAVTATGRPRRSAALASVAFFSDQSDDSD